MTTTTANKEPIFQTEPSTPGLTIVNADSTTLKTLVTAGADGALVDNISVVSNDTSAVDLVVVITVGAVDYNIGEVEIPIGAGTGTTVSHNLLNTTDMPFLQQNGSLPLQASAILKVGAKVAVTAAKTVYVVAYGGQY